MKKNVQITLDGEDASLYHLIKNKKQFMSSALKLFYKDEQLKMIFFNEDCQTEDKPSASHSQEVTAVKSEVPKTTTSSKKGW